MVTCPACGARNRDETRPCDWCGAELQAASDRCLVCGSPVPPPQQYCPQHLGTAEGRLLSEQSRRPGAWVLAAPAQPSGEEEVGPAVRGPTTLSCATCGRENPEDASFCGHCGRNLAQLSCPACRRPHPPGLRFCPGCGASLRGPPVPPPAQPPAGATAVTAQVSRRPAAPSSRAAAPAAVEYAGFWQRVLAFTIDSIVAALAAIFLSGAFSGGALPGTAVGFAIWWGYFLLSNSVGRLAGKALFGIRVIDPATGAEPGFAKGALRTVGLAVSLLVSSFSFGLPFLMMVWDGRKRTVHDLIAGTVVVRN